MSPAVVFKHEFVELMPSEPAPGTIYISIRFATASHLCACGCGNKVVTPIRPTDWKLIFDGKTVSLDPSIGNWSFPCQSHYWIRNNAVRWAEKWSREEIEAGRAQDRYAKDRYFARAEPPPPDHSVPQASQPAPEMTLWQKLTQWLRS